VCFFRILLWAAGCSYTVRPPPRDPPCAATASHVPLQTPPSPCRAAWVAPRPRRTKYCARQVVGMENLDENQTYFFCSNHESHFDVPLIFSTLPFWLISIAKKSLMYIPIFGWAVAAGGTVWIDRKNTEKVRSSTSLDLATKPGLWS